MTVPETGKEAQGRIRGRIDNLMMSGLFQGEKLETLKFPKCDAYSNVGVRGKLTGESSDECHQMNFLSL